MARVKYASVLDFGKIGLGVPVGESMNLGSVWLKSEGSVWLKSEFDEMLGQSIFKTEYLMDHFWKRDVENGMLDALNKLEAEREVVSFALL